MDPQLKVVTWNIQWARGVDGRVDLERIVARLMHGGAPDVVLLQEVAAGFAGDELPGCDGSDQAAALVQRLAGYECAIGWASDLPPRHPGAPRRRFGNFVASRLPMLQVWPHLLPWPAEAGVRSMQRLALEATLQAPFGPLRVISTHLEYYSQPQRAAQCARLRELHAEAVAHARTPRPGPAHEGPFDAVPRAAAALLAGDMNCEAGSAELQQLQLPFADATPPWCDAWHRLHGSAPRPPTLGVHDRAQWPQPRAFDHVFVSADLAPRLRTIDVDAETDASDHQPVRIVLHAG